MRGTKCLNRIARASYEQSKQIDFVPGVLHHLGYGITHPIALEFALKLEELTDARLRGHFWQRIQP